MRREVVCSALNVLEAQRLPSPSPTCTSTKSKAFVSEGIGCHHRTGRGSAFRKAALKTFATNVFTFLQPVWSKIRYFSKPIYITDKAANPTLLASGRKSCTKSLNAKQSPAQVYRQSSWEQNGGFPKFQLVVLICVGFQNYGSHS